MAQHPAVHISAGGTNTVTDFGGPLLASEDMEHEHHDVAVRDTMMSSPMQEPAVPGRRIDSAPSAGAVVSFL